MSNFAFLQTEWPLVFEGNLHHAKRCPRAYAAARWNWRGWRTAPSLPYRTT
jgi:hypothetical protein